jgi:hypothetical protein
MAPSPAIQTGATWDLTLDVAHIVRARSHCQSFPMTSTAVTAPDSPPQRSEGRLDELCLEPRPNPGGVGDALSAAPLRQVTRRDQKGSPATSVNAATCG